MHLAILTPSSPGTTFAANELDFQVRDVTGYFLIAIDTPKLYFNLRRSQNLNVSDLLQSQNKISKTYLNHVVSTPRISLVELSFPDKRQENKAKRVISIGQLNDLHHLHTQPIKLVVYKHP